MTDAQCECPNGHKFTRSEAAAISYICDECNQKISCAPEKEKAPAAVGCAPAEQNATSG
jgi:hypothetical protein